MLFGHEDKIGIFKKLVKERALGHAYLFYGDPQIGKFSFAVSLANFLESGKFEIGERMLTESKIVLPEEGGIGIDSAREIKKFLSQSPISSPKRLVVINEAHLLTMEAQAALLKIVEEPFLNSLIIFIASELQTILPPLLSRLTKVYFMRMTKNEVKNILVKEYKITLEKADKISEISFGRMGYALHLLENKEKREDDDLEQDLEDKIVELYIGGLKKNSSILNTLLDRESAIKRFNLNGNLQRKAIEYELNR
ncbi:MAG: AAA family ATPase [Patescibacteria group bacterium]